MNFPATVRIGYRDYKLIPVERRTPEQDHPLLPEEVGESDPTAQTIHYRADGSPQGVTNTVLHECLHALLTHFDLLQDEVVLEEHVVTTLSNGLCSLMSDNPVLIIEIMRGLGVALRLANEPSPKLANEDEPEPEPMALRELIERGRVRAV